MSNNPGETMASRSPLISVGIPVYNEERYLPELLDSIVEQTHENLEIVVSDNASTDRTWEIIQQYAARDTRFRATRQRKNIGALRNFDFTLAQARGPYFIWAGGHDRWAPNMLERSVCELEARRRTMLVAPKTVWIDALGEVLREDSRRIDTRGASSPSVRVLTMYRQMTRCSAYYGLFRTEALRQANLVLPGVINSDFVLLMKVAALGDVVTPDDTCWYRREIRRELSRATTSRRQIAALGVTGVAALVPLLASRGATLGLFLGLDGTARQRAELVTYGLRQYFGRRQLPVLWEELTAALSDSFRQTLVTWLPTLRTLEHPVLVTSVPKSGTNLLMNMVRVLPGAHRQGDASLAAERHESADRLAYIQERVHETTPGAYYTGHFPYDDEVARWIAARGFKHLFIIRDPRDYCVSVCHYIMRDAPRRHAYYELYRSFGSDHERLMKVIRGHGEGRTQYRLGPTSIPNIRIHFEAYLGWLDREDTWTVKYEELISADGTVDPGAPARIGQMLSHLGLPGSEGLVRGVIREGMAPSRSRTFRKGGSGSWRRYFSPQHVAAFKQVAGDLLERLGYTW
jgi:Glycosyl transferase family 2/Sulfotransferase domain